MRISTNTQKLRGTLPTTTRTLVQDEGPMQGVMALLDTRVARAPAYTPARRDLQMQGGQYADIRSKLLRTLCQGRLVAVSSAPLQRT